MLTVFGALQYLGTLIAPMMGVASDRIGHRNVLCAMRAIYTVLAFALMMLAFAGVVTPVHRAGHRDPERDRASLGYRRARRAGRRDHAVRLS